jgi:hypothetical protein
MQKFPGLKDSQVALVRADINTGTVLDENYKYAIDDNQKVFTLFKDVDQALSFAKLIITERKDIECYIYKIENQPIFMLDANKVVEF